LRIDYNRIILHGPSHEAFVHDKATSASTRVAPATRGDPDPAQPMPPDEALRRADAYNRSLLEASLDPLVTIGPDGKITDVNAATEAVTGCDRTALVGTDFSDYFTDPERARAGYQQVFRDGLVRDYPLEVRHRDGHLTSVLYNASVYRDPGGEVIGVFAAARDITERKRAEEALRASEQRYRTLFETMDEGFCVVEMLYDQDGTPRDYRFVEVNPAFEKHTGLADALGRTICELVPGHDAHWFEIYGRVAQTGEAVRFENRAAAMGRWYDVYAFRLDSPEGARVAILFSDITARKRAEEETLEMAAELRRSNQELEHFAYVASHDLQEPLRTVSSFSQLLARRYRGRLDRDADDFLGFVVDGAARMQSLINDLLTFSRIGTRGNPFAPVACEDAVRTAGENLGVAIAESGAVVTHGPLPTVRADATQLTQLFQNLLGNSIKFRRPDEPPRVHISAAREDSAWRFSVRDNGIGIDPQYFDRIFIIFQRLHGRAEYPGTGIGLAVCKKIVERHGGRLWVESEPGRSATFHFTIPDEKTP
jgi:PAS domain S-box-containing protein